MKQSRCCDVTVSLDLNREATRNLNRPKCPEYKPSARGKSYYTPYHLGLKDHCRGQNDHLEAKSEIIVSEFIRALYEVEYVTHWNIFKISSFLSSG